MIGGVVIGGVVIGGGVIEDCNPQENLAIDILLSFPFILMNKI